MEFLLQFIIFIYVYFTISGRSYNYNWICYVQIYFPTLYGCNNFIFGNSPLIAYVENNKSYSYYLAVPARFGFDLKPIAVAHGLVKFSHKFFFVCQKYELLLLDNWIARPVGCFHLLSCIKNLHTVNFLMIRLLVFSSSLQLWHCLNS